MIRIAALSLIASLFTTPVVAETCTLKNNYCVPFVACTEDGAEFFFGQSYGRRSGPLTALGVDGTECLGDWRSVRDDVGKARFKCSDGRRGRGTLVYFGRNTGTSIGEGRISGGKRIRFWSGPDILDFLETDPSVDRKLAQCIQRAERARTTS